MNFKNVGLVGVGSIVGALVGGGFLVGSQLKFGPSFAPGKTMKSCGNWPKATRIYTIDILDAPGQYSLFGSIPYVSKKPFVSRTEIPTASGTEEQDPTVDPIVHSQLKDFGDNTPLDLNLSLQSEPQAGKDRYVIIRIRLIDPRFSFMDKRHSITIDPFDINSRKMFCRLQTREREILIKSKYYRPWFKSGAVYGGFNIGVFVKAGVGPGNKEMVVPIFIDPKVSNNG
jgi:hypothetical protein